MAGSTRRSSDATQMKLPSCLEDLDRMNRTFMRLGARQYAKIVETQWADISSAGARAFH